MVPWLQGTETAKNAVALEALRRLLAVVEWANLHQLPGYRALPAAFLPQQQQLLLFSPAAAVFASNRSR